ncbi:MAG: SsrA-binding protein SmpB [Lentisphaerae bacterium]|jgi:SsrA-binding protein|nr:SsrA-binding protein SmpB [Lentisphaerota bacterium]
MTGKGKRKQDNGVLATNRKAFHDYTILEKLEVGIALVGTEVKVLRGGGVGLTGAYVRVENGSLWLMQANFPPYSFGNRFNHESLRPRRLLAHKREIRRLQALQEQKGLTLIPLRFYVAPKTGRIKLEIGVGRGKQQADKRETLRRREADLDARRAMASHGRR